MAAEPPHAGRRGGVTVGRAGRAGRVTVVGAGWAGLAAAVRLVQAGCAVTVHEMAAGPGGRARSLAPDPPPELSPAAPTDSPPAASDAPADAAPAFDNGQHILIGAYARTLDLMRSVGADPERLLLRLPLTLRHADGRGLQLPPGPAVPAFLRGVAGARGWSAGDKLALLGAAAAWALRGFRCHPALTVHGLTQRLPPRVRELLIDPLCVAALNTPARDASAQVLLRVLRDALFGGRGASDLLLPRAGLSTLLPGPARGWLLAAGAQWRAPARVRALAPAPGGGWSVDGGPAQDAVVLACSAAEAARLVQAVAPGWSATAAGFAYEPIVTVYVQAGTARLPAPLLALREGPQAPAQFVFDHGALGGPHGRWAFVVSGAGPWVDAGSAATGAAVLAQARALLPPGAPAPVLLRTIAEKRATFRCVPALARPPGTVAPELFAAGDYVEGPYPATLEGAVRSGEAAAAAAVQATGRLRPG